MEKFYNRELSWLQFNDRVLQEAQDESVPLLGRLRFLGIFSNNQDEFVRVRLADIIRTAEHRRNPEAGELLDAINEQMELSRRQFAQTYDNIITRMEREGIRVVNHEQLSEKQREFCAHYFSTVVSVRLVPIMLRKSLDIPFLPDGKIYLAVKLAGERSSRYAIIQLPVSDTCRRFVLLPSKKGHTDVIFLDDIVRMHLREVFFMFNYDTITAHAFKVVRDADFVLDDDVNKSQSEKMFRGLSQREHGRPVRLVYDREMPHDVLQTLARKLGLKRPERLEAGGRYHQMRDLLKFPAVRPDLEERRPEPLTHPAIDPSRSIMAVIRRQDILLSYPYHTFNHFIDLLREAAVDPRVQSISITLYRTAHHSKVINALLSAVRNGKHVTALVELKARFDEEQNIDNTEVLQSGGVHVLHSMEELKVHSKLLLIERKEGKKLRGYVYVGTGNFNEDTTRIYSDFGLLTTDESAAADARKVFDFLQNAHKRYEYKRLMVSPHFMREQLDALIEREIRNARRGKPAYIHGKFNSLTDNQMIEKLYDASRAGVDIRLIVRGACCLQAGVEEMSENIRVRSIVDKYLEHARLLTVCNDSRPQSWIMSADPMTRNLDRRVEVGIPIRNKAIQKTLEEYFRIQWRDNVKARIIEPPYLNTHIPRAKGETAHRCQDELYDYFKL